MLGAGHGSVCPERKGYMQFVTNLLPMPSGGSDIAPQALVPAIIGGAIVIFLVIFFTARKSKRRRKMQALYMSSELGMELDAEEVKTESKAKFEQARGYVPGKTPRSSYLSKDRIGEQPHEIIKVRETYNPTMELPKAAAEEELKAKKTVKKKTKVQKAGTSKQSSIPKLAPAYAAPLPKRAAPLDIPKVEEKKPPVLNPIPAQHEKRMPLLSEDSRLAPALLPQRRLEDIQQPVHTPVRMPTPPIARSTAKLPKPQESYARYHGAVNPLPKRPTLPPARIVDDGEMAAYLASQGKKKKKR